MINWLWSVDYGAHTNSITAPVKNAPVSAGLALIKFRCSNQHTSVSMYSQKIEFSKCHAISRSLYTIRFLIIISTCFFPFCVRTLFYYGISNAIMALGKSVCVFVFSQLYSYVAAITHSCGWLRHSADDFSIRIIFSDREGALPWPIKVGISPKKAKKEDDDDSAENFCLW
jgi:hypothetical protein